MSRIRFRRSSSACKRCAGLEEYSAGVLSGQFNDGSGTHAAADAQRSQPAPRAAPFHFVHKRHEYSRAAATDRVAERDAAAVDVEFLAWHRHLAQHAEYLGG